LTFPAKLNRLLSVIVELTRERLTLNVRVLGLAVIVKSGFGTIRGRFKVLAGGVPLVPVKVIV
jgi:hypothetical protein